MIKMFKRIFSLRPSMSWQQREIERYLANSTDHFDLECRQKDIIYGRKNL